ncbi:MarP family serine protease [Galbitalea soli]|uniref:MarP family serine protease n=1 Tax=Galbitalea soli TaxID=1268042 RepID=A0A7C9TNT1_9MICO|nr:MarP family serine protease [Galbitalea soli]NEM90376.1 MarP family serine protease [Galbitalea soli]NYJ31086.1 S1-C subfamily serine protease [Galbitalea soli]
MPGSLIADIVVLVLLIGYLVNGIRNGLVRSLAGILGVAAGGLAAVLLIPFVAAWVPDPNLRTIATLAAVVALVVIGHSLGAFLGGLLYRRVRRTALRVPDRALGGILTTIVAALVVSMIASSIVSLGIPFVSQAVASSTIVRTINALTPDPVQAFLAKIRSSTVDTSLPRIAEAFGAHPRQEDIPSVNTGTAALVAASRSVVKITGNAYACGQSQSGSGFVVSHDRVVTNAHVVAGVAQPLVEVRGQGAVQGTIVYFDPVGDIAVIAVKDLPAPALRLGASLAEGDKAVADGYPFGGPFVTLPAGVATVGTISVPDIYGTSSHPREVYSLAADIEEGDSGGPLLHTDGSVGGLVFAKSATTKNVGYAITMKSLEPVAKSAPTLTAAVSSGRCTKG